MARRQLDNLRAIVTGASSGIGWQLAMQLAQHNAQVVAVARRSERLDELRSAAEALPGRIVTVVGDFSLIFSPPRYRFVFCASKRPVGERVRASGASE